MKTSDRFFRTFIIVFAVLVSTPLFIAVPEACCEQVASGLNVSRVYHSYGIQLVFKRTGWPVFPSQFEGSWAQKALDLSVYRPLLSEGKRIGASRYLRVSPEKAPLPVLPLLGIQGTIGPAPKKNHMLLAVLGGVF